MCSHLWLEHEKNSLAEALKKNPAKRGLKLLFFEGIASVVARVEVNENIFFGSDKPFAQYLIFFSS